jgi:hypothetical protein
MSILIPFWCASLPGWRTFFFSAATRRNGAGGHRFTHPWRVIENQSAQPHERDCALGLLSFQPSHGRAALFVREKDFE